MNVDLAITFNQCQLIDIDKVSSIYNQVYKCPDLFQTIIVDHEVLIETGIKPVYVYDGMAPEVKKKEERGRCDLLKRQVTDILRFVRYHVIVWIQWSRCNSLQSD